MFCLWIFPANTKVTCEKNKVSHTTTIFMTILVKQRHQNNLQISAHLSYLWYIDPTGQ